MQRPGRGPRASIASVLGLGVLLLAAAPALADGSRDLYPNAAGGSRANSEWRTSTYGGGAVYRRTLLHAYAVAGEYLLMGSSGVGVGSGDVFVWNPGLVTGALGHENLPASTSYTCSAQRATSGIAVQGQITSRAQELAGPDTVPAGGGGSGYTPCFYQAPSTGIYSVAMIGPAGTASDVNGTVGTDVGLTNANDFNATQGSSVAAWDLTIRGSLSDATTTRSGRVFAYVLALFTSGNGLPVNLTTYPVTLDGYRYRTDDRGLDPNGWVQYANQLGFLDPDGQTPLYHDALAQNTGNPAQLTNIQGGVQFATPAYPVFLAPPDPAALSALGIPLTATAPSVSNVGFTGSETGSTSFYQTGGTFHFTNGAGGVYEIVISRDGVSFDPTSTQNRVLRGVRGAGAQTVSWDGKDNSGAYFPVGANYAFRMRVHAGEYHFPFVDVENNTGGGPTITLLNPPNSTCPALAGGCTSGFYDDRGYTTTTGQTVGTPGAVLCGNAAPATPASDPLNGFNTTSAQRKFGTASGGNTNVPCTGSFGDAKGLDLWTYYPSPAGSGVLSIVNSADIGVTDTVDNATPPVGSTVTFTVTATNHGPDGATGVAVNNALPAGVTFVSASTGTGSFNSATGMWMIGSLSNGGSATLTVTARVDVAGARLDTATKTAEDQADPNPANNAASVQVNGQAADIGVTDSVDTARPAVGATVTFTVTATNHGPDDATGVQIHDALPAGLTLVTASPSTGTYDPATGVWSLGALSNGAAATMALRAVVLQSGAITDVATRTASAPPDLNAANDSASATINPPSADLAVTLTPPPSFSPGSSGDYVIIVTNRGPTPAADPITVTDTLPPGVTFAGFSGDGWSCSAGGRVVTCTHPGPLPVGASEPPLVIHVVATSVQPNTVLLDTVSVSSPTPDPVLSNNRASGTTPVAGAAGPETPDTGGGALAALLGQGGALLLCGLALLIAAQRRRPCRAG